MPSTPARLAGLAALCAALLLAPSAFAAGTSKASSSGVSQSAKASERAYGKHCGPKRKPGGARSSDFAKCVAAMSKLASGRSSSPQNACRQLSHKRRKGKPSPFERCVKAGAKLVKRGKTGAGSGDNPGGLDPDGLLDDIDDLPLDPDEPDAVLPGPGDVPTAEDLIGADPPDSDTADGPEPDDDDGA